MYCPLEFAVVEIPKKAEEVPFTVIKIVLPAVAVPFKVGVLSEVIKSVPLIPVSSEILVIVGLAKIVTLNVAAVLQGLIGVYVTV